MVKLKGIIGDNMNSAEGKAAKIRKYVALHPIVVLFVLMLVTAIVVYSPYLFLKQIFVYSDIGSDTVYVYYPFFSSLARKISNQDFSMWDFTYGTGNNILTRQSDVGSIFTWLTCIFGAKYIKYALAIVQILKIFCAGFACYFYLNNFKFSVVSKVVVAYIYAFNGFIILWGQHYFFASASIYVVLLLGSIEKSLTSKKGYIYTVLSSFALLFTSYYLGYMTLLFAGVYTAFRMVHLYTFEQKKIVLSKLGGLLCSVVIGGMISAVLFLPSVYLTLSSSNRLSSDMSFLQKIVSHIRTYAIDGYDLTTSAGIISRMFSNNLMDTTDYVGLYNYYEMPQLFFTCLIVFMCIIYIIEIVVDGNEKKKIKILKFSEVILILYLLFFPLLSVILNGFVCPIFRYTFIVMPLFALCFADVLDKIIHRKLKYRNFEILLACIVSLLVLVIVSFRGNTSSRILQLLVCVCFGVIIAVTLFSLYLQSICKSLVKKYCALIGIVLVIFSNVCIECYATTNYRVKTSEVNSKIYYTAGNDDVAEALDYLEKNDGSFYRVEKMFTDISEFNDSMLEGYYGISTYNSVLNKNLCEFAEKICPEFIAVGDPAYNDFNLIWKDVNFVSLLGVKYILSYEKIEDVPQYEYIYTAGDVYVYRNNETEGIGSFYSKVIDCDSYLNMDESAKKTVLRDTLILQNVDENDSGGMGIEESRVSLEKPKKSSHVIGQVEAKQDGYIFVTIPFENGWKAYVDGSEVEILQADIGYSAIRIEEGCHDILFEYNTPLLKEGIIISLVGIVCFIGWSAYLFRATKKKHEDNYVDNYLE